ncbi:MAG: glycosyltransferase [Thermoanaerobaculia bacterium]
MTHRVCVCIVTYDSAADLPGCLAAVAAQDHRPLEVVIVDCASSDDSVAVAGEAETGDVSKRVVALAENLGFAGGMNRAFADSDAPYLLTLNADARPRPDFVRRLLERIVEDRDDRVGAVTGRLVRPVDGDTRRLDACGMMLTRTWRHLDRGSGEIDRGQLERAERVFGATGAASLFARAALDDVRFDDLGGESEVFDSRFHSFREDAELAFRFQERGWEVVYEPRAVAEHRRRVLPDRRRQMPAAINYHSLKNRYLLRLYHQTSGNFLRTLVPTLWRDLLAFGWVVLAERSSLGAYGWLWRHRREILARRRFVQQRRTRPPEAVDRWFRHRALPL